MFQMMSHLAPRAAEVVDIVRHQANLREGARPTDVVGFGIVFVLYLFSPFADNFNTFTTRVDNYDL